MSSPELVERFSSGLGLWVVCACKVGRQTLFLRYNYGVKLVRAQDGGGTTCSSYRDLSWSVDLSWNILDTWM